MSTRFPAVKPAINPLFQPPYLQTGSVIVQFTHDPDVIQGIKDEIDSNPLLVMPDDIQPLCWMRVYPDGEIDLSNPFTDFSKIGWFSTCYIVYATRFDPFVDECEGELDNATDWDSEIRKLDRGNGLVDCPVCGTSYFLAERDTCPYCDDNDELDNVTCPNCDYDFYAGDPDPLCDNWVTCPSCGIGLHLVVPVVAVAPVVAKQEVDPAENECLDTTTTTTTTYANIDTFATTKAHCEAVLAGLCNIMDKVGKTR